MEGLNGFYPQETNKNPEIPSQIKDQKFSSEGAGNNGDMLVDSLDSAIEAVRLNPNTTASTMPILEWDTVELQLLDPARGIYIIKVAGFPDPVGATSDKDGFLSRFSKAS